MWGNGCMIYGYVQAEKELRMAKSELRKSEKVLKMDELHARQRVLRRLNYCDESGVILPKVRCVHIC